MSLIACHECDLLQQATELKRAAAARCGRCNALLYRRISDNLDRPLALTMAASILFIIANLFPIVGLELQGQSTATTLIGTVGALWAQGMRPLALLVLATTILAPALELTAMSYLLVSLRLGRVPQRLVPALRVLHAIRPWGMVEVFLLGVLVSLAKLSNVAQVVPGMALWSLGGLLMLIAAAVASFDARALWAKQSIAQ